MPFANYLFLQHCAILFFVFSANCHGDYPSTYKKKENNGHYLFGYNIKDIEGSTNFRKEKENGWGQVSGSYGFYNSKDGRMRIVNYEADKKGFRAVVKTNEKGTTNENSASAIYDRLDKNLSNSFIKNKIPDNWKMNKNMDQWNPQNNRWHTKRKIRHKMSYGWDGKQMKFL